MTDEQIMSLVAKGDLNQMRILFDRYHTYVFNFFLKNGHAYALSEDLAQNVFERILKYRETYQSTLPFKAWFFRIARNVESDQVRKKAVLLEGNPQMEKLQLESENILDKIEATERHQQLYKALKTLSAEEQEIIHFSKFQKMKYSEISQVMAISEGAIKVKMFRAMKKLKSYYQKKGEI